MFPKKLLPRFLGKCSCIQDQVGLQAIQGCQDKRFLLVFWRQTACYDSCKQKNYVSRFYKYYKVVQMGLVTGNSVPLSRPLVYQNDNMKHPMIVLYQRDGAQPKEFYCLVKD